MRPPLASKAFWTACDAALLVAGLWLVAAMPVPFIGGGYDDLLFVREANALLDGRWLGDFDQMTLSKGCVYPLFLAAMAALHVPILLATQVVYLAACLLFSRIGAATGAASTLRFALLAASPVLLDGSSAMLMREPLYAALTLAVLATLARLLLVPARWPWALLGGGTLAAFWLTREEGLWLLPALGVLALGSLRGRTAISPLPPYGRGRGPSRSGGRVRVLLRLNSSALRPMALLAAFALCILAAGAMNKSLYGVFRTNDFQQGPFPAAYGALSRIEHASWQRLIPVPQDARLHAYAVSPAARELQPFLEGEAGRDWVRVSCQNNPIPDCHDIQAGWFVWALRDAVTRAGHYGSAHEADRFYRSLAQQIDAACDARRIACLPARAGYLPPLRHIDFGRVLLSAMLLARDAASLGPASPHGLPTLVQEPVAALYRRVTPHSTPAPAFSFEEYPGWSVAGRLASAESAIRLSVAPAPGGIVRSSLATDEAQGGVAAFAGEIRCAPGACRLQAVRAGQPALSWPLDLLAQGQMLDAPGLRILLDRLVPLRTATAAPPPMQEYIAGVLARVATPLGRVGLPAALLWTLWRCVRDLRRRSLAASTVLAAATAIAIASRIAFLAIVDATSIPVLYRYETPEMVLVPALIGLMLADALQAARA